MPDFFLQNPADFYWQGLSDADKWDVYKESTTTLCFVTQVITMSDPVYSPCLRYRLSQTSYHRGFLYKLLWNIIPGKYFYEVTFNSKDGILYTFLQRRNPTSAIGNVINVATNNRWRTVKVEYNINTFIATLFIWFYRETGPDVWYYLRQVKFYGNALNIDPDDYSISYDNVEQANRTLTGREEIFRRGRHLIFDMRFPLMRHTSFAKLANAAKMKASLMFVDGIERIATEYAIVGTLRNVNYKGVTAGSLSKAYFTQTTATPVGRDDFQANPFTNAQYQAIASNDAVQVTNAITGTGRYGYHKFVIRVTGYATKSSIKSFYALWRGSADDKSPANVDGVNLYAWNGFQWVLLKRSRTSDQQLLQFATTNKEQAQQFVDTTNGYVRLLVQTRGQRSATASMAIRTNYVEASVNRGIGRTISLAIPAQLSVTGAVVRVINRNIINTVIATTFFKIQDLLTLNASTKGYRVEPTHQHITVTHDVTAGATIEVQYKYNPLVRIQSVTQDNIYAGNIARPNSSVRMVMRTVTPIRG